MDDETTRTPVAEFMHGYVRLAGLEYSSERLTELESEIATLYEDMARMWTTPIGDAEPAVGFAVEKIYTHE